MSYNANIPQGSDLISNSQAQILNNFTALNQIFGSNSGADHYQWDATNNAGLHKQVNLPVVRSTDPTLSSADTGMYYSKLVSGVSQPFFAGWNGSSTVVTQLGGSGSTPVLTPGTNGYVIFPGGFIMQWGFVSPVTTPGTAIVFPISFPTACFSVQVTAISNAPVTNNITVSNGTILPAGFRILSTSPVTVSGVYFFAMGN